MDISVDIKLPDDWDSESIFRKVIVSELFHGSNSDIYLHFRIDYVSIVVQTEAPQFVDLGLLDVNTLDEFSILCNPTTRIIRSMDVFHMSALNHVFGEATMVGINVARSDHDYIYKTDFEIWREKQDFGRQNISISQSHLESSTISTNMSNRTTSQFDSIPIETKNPEPMP